MPAGSGRKEAPEWREVVLIDDNATTVQCEYRHSEISAKIERVKSHLKKCDQRAASTQSVLRTCDDEHLHFTQSRSESSLRISNKRGSVSSSAALTESDISSVSSGSGIHPRKLCRNRKQ